MRSKRAAVFSPLDNGSGLKEPRTPQNKASPEEVSVVEPPKTRGQKKGTKMELLVLQSGGSGRRPWSQVPENKTKWRLCQEVKGNKDDEETWSSKDSSDSFSSSEDDSFASFEEEEENEIFLTDLIGNRIFPVRKLQRF